LVPANAGVPGTITDRREFMGTKLGAWTTDGRPVPAGRVLFGYNTTLELVEYYDPVAEAWEPVAPPINELNDIGDVDITTPTDGDLLVYDDGDWINQALAKSQLPTGTILQVVSTTKTDIFSASVAQGVATAITGLSASITPSSTSSKIMVFVTVTFGFAITGNSINLNLKRGSTSIGIGDSSGSRVRRNTAGQMTSSGDLQGSISTQFLDSPGVATALTYSVEIGHTSGETQTIIVNSSVTDSNSASYSRTTSSITVMEVAG